jgi:hypothetical protein
MARLDREDAELDGGDVDRRRRLDSSTSHQQQLLRRPETTRAWWLGFAELGRFREREEEVEARIGSSGGVLFYGVEGAFL